MLVVIESKDNALFKNTRKLKERKYRTKENKYIIEGFRLVQEAFKAKCSIEYLIVNEHGKDKINDYLQEYVDNIKIYELKNELFTQLVSTENTQGIIAVVNINNSIKKILVFVRFILEFFLYNYFIFSSKLVRDTNHF